MIKLLKNIETSNKDTLILHRLKIWKNYVIEGFIIGFDPKFYHIK